MSVNFDQKDCSDQHKRRQNYKKLQTMSNFEHLLYYLSYYSIRLYTYMEYLKVKLAFYSRIMVFEIC